MEGEHWYSRSGQLCQSPVGWVELSEGSQKLRRSPAPVNPSVPAIVTILSRSQIDRTRHRRRERRSMLRGPAWTARGFRPMPRTSERRSWPRALPYRSAGRVSRARIVGAVRPRKRLPISGNGVGGQILLRPARLERALHDHAFIARIGTGDAPGRVGELEARRRADFLNLGGGHFQIDVVADVRAGDG